MLIASYHKDFEWLQFCLLSLARFAEGFLPPAIVVTSEDKPNAERLVAKVFPAASVHVEDGPAHLGSLRGQVSMCKSDIFCPAADVVYFLGSDCLALRKFSPDIFFFENKPIMLYTPYSAFTAADHGVKLWQAVTERHTGFPVPNEYMRRLPLPYPRGLLAPARRYLETLHGKTFEEHIYSGGKGAACQTFSESNYLGAYAHKFMPELYYWCNTLDKSNWPYAIMQFYSWGGLDYADPRGIPREIISSVLGIPVADTRVMLSEYLKQQ